MFVSTSNFPSFSTVIIIIVCVLFRSLLDICKRSGTDTLETGDWGSRTVGHNFYYNWWLLKRAVVLSANAQKLFPGTRRLLGELSVGALCIWCTTLHPLSLSRIAVFRSPTLLCSVLLRWCAENASVHARVFRSD